MKLDIRSVLKLIPTVLLGFATIAPAFAQGPGVLDKGTVTKLEVAVWRAADRSEIAQLQLGDTLRLAEGESVILRLYAPRGHAGPGDQRYYIPGKIYLAKGGGVDVSQVDVGKGSALVTATKEKRVAEIRYELAKGIQVSKPYMSKGVVKVEVTEASAAQPEPPPGLTRPEQMIQRLYAGILLRDFNPDNPNGREWVDRVRRGGYPELVEVAYEIVESEESQERVPARGVSDRDRLLAIYEHLLDLESDEIDQYQYRDHFEMVSEGDVTGVVMDIVRSPEFRRVHGYNL